ncbi:hypothetical protein [Duganella rhizosphaerae]|uniref:hypothetical protein n=1 Tax=Duganella rhizosphaerae TaxID=2885763 RepID=UPI00403F7F23
MKLTKCHHSKKRNISPREPRTAAADGAVNADRGCAVTRSGQAVASTAIEAHSEDVVGRMVLLDVVANKDVFRRMMIGLVEQ